MLEGTPSTQAEQGSPPSCVIGKVTCLVTAETQEAKPAGGSQETVCHPK